MAQASSHPNTLAYALCWVTWVHKLRREVQATQVQAEAVIALSEEPHTYPQILF